MSRTLVLEQIRLLKHSIIKNSTHFYILESPLESAIKEVSKYTSLCFKSLSCSSSSQWGCGGSDPWGGDYFRL